MGVQDRLGLNVEHLVLVLGLDVLLSKAVVLPEAFEALLVLLVWYFLFRDVLIVSIGNNKVNMRALISHQMRGLLV